MEYYGTFVEIDECSNKIKKLLLKLDDLVHGLKHKQELEESANSLENFLKSDLVTLDPKLYCRQKVFVVAFNDYCRENHLKAAKWTAQLYGGLFSDIGLEVVNNTRKKYPNAPEGKIYTETFIVGVDVKIVESDSESDNE